MYCPGIDQPIEIDPGLDPQPVQHVHHVLGRDVAGRAFRIRTPAQPGDARVEGRDAHLQAGVDVGERLAVGVVEMAAHFGRSDSASAPAPSPPARACGVPTPIVSATPQWSTPIAFISRTTRSTSSGVTSPWYGQPSAHEIAARTLMPCACAAATTGAKRSMLSSMLQLMLRWLKASLAAPKTTISSGHARAARQRRLQALHVRRQHRIAHARLRGGCPPSPARCRPSAAPISG